MTREYQSFWMTSVPRVPNAGMTEYSQVPGYHTREIVEYQPLKWLSTREYLECQKLKWLEYSSTCEIVEHQPMKWLKYSRYLSAKSWNDWVQQYSRSVAYQPLKWLSTREYLECQKLKWLSAREYLEYQKLKWLSTAVLAKLWSINRWNDLSTRGTWVPKAEMTEYSSTRELWSINRWNGLSTREYLECQKLKWLEHSRIPGVSTADMTWNDWVLAST